MVFRLMIGAEGITLVKVSGVLLVAATVALVGCGSSAAKNPPNIGGSSSLAAQHVDRTLVLATRSELDTLAGKALGAHGGEGDSSARRLFNADLALLDGKGVARPYLAEALPQVKTDSWRVEPDGRMETSYRLKPNLTWQDGTPPSADDFVFAWNVYATPEFGLARSSPISEMEDVTAPDDRTIVISWSRPYPNAGALIAEQFPPLPRHILASAFQTDASDAFMSEPFWTAHYVGLGPYHIDRWEQGSFLEATSFDGHTLGRPHIDRIQLRFMSDSNAVLANLLANDVHVTLPYTIYIQQATVLERQWQNGGVLIVPAGWRRSEVQYRPEYTNPRALLDVRVRAALAHALDKDALNASVFEGKGFLADLMIPPTVDYYPQIDQVITKHPHDLQKAEQLLAEAGYQKGGDGVAINASGERLTVELRANASADLQSEMTVMASQWRQAGFDIRETPVPLAQARDGQYRGTFPGLYTGGGGFGEGGLGSFSTSAISRLENHWTGQNRGGYANPGYDRLFDTYSTALERSDRIQAIVGMARIFTQDVAAISIHFSPNVIAHPTALNGAEAFDPNTLVTWNVYDWSWGN